MVRFPNVFAYKAVFAFAIFMMLLTLLGSSTIEIGALLWGYGGAFKYFMIIFVMLLVVALYLIQIYSFDDRKSLPIVGDGKAMPTFSGSNKSSYGVNRDYLIRQIIERKIIAFPARAEVYGDINQIYSLPSNRYSKAMSVTQVITMEDNNVWWVLSNTLFIRVFNPQNSVLVSIIFSLKRGNCGPSNTNKKQYLLLLFDDNSVKPFDTKVFQIELPFDYVKFYQTGVVSCGDIEGGFSVP